MVLFAAGDIGHHWYILVGSHNDYSLYVKSFILMESRILQQSNRQYTKSFVLVESRTLQQSNRQYVAQVLMDKLLDGEKDARGVLGLRRPCFVHQGAGSGASPRRAATPAQ